MYTIWWVAEDFSSRQILTGWSRLCFWQRLNDVQPLEVLAFPHNVLEGINLPDYARIQVYDGDRIVWSGHLCGEDWGVTERGYEDVVFQGIDSTGYARRALVVPQQADAVVEDGTYVWPQVGDRLIQYGYVDDLMRYLVRSQLMIPLNPQRIHSDISCEDDQSLGTYLRTDVGTDSLLTALQAQAKLDRMLFRFVPLEDGARFEVRRQWGLDRTGQHVVELTRHNLTSLHVHRYYGEVENAVFGKADGGGVMAPQIVPAFNQESIDQYGIGEVLVTSSGAPANIHQIVQAVASQAEPEENVLVEQLSETYGVKWALGDIFTVRAFRGTREFNWPMIVTAVRVEVAATGIVQAEPVLEVYHA